ncbi:peptidoglycan editing factor PgeF [Alloacidobacterium dinghuense]|uniref:Purine nucleoside phosphorylase n=1 Tax=Alloacidobacterium dinghuense TaxID=2763107 RepID=A0A7G8BJY5_9BACT|nr:peptidoglycan editing factor PgeF [Alloacidobacterium dinghuense]QNI32855.1 peptidoglycan editing factor PgeF [Alloacidobacterium dinghuense]
MRQAAESLDCRNWSEGPRRPAPQKQKHLGVDKERIEVVQAPAWSELPWLMHGFSTRTGGKSTAYRPDQPEGELNLGFTASDSKETVLANRRLFVSAVAKTADTPALVTLKQVHSSITHVVGKADADDVAKHKGDGMMTIEPGILLGIQTADCIPVIIADRQKRAVAAFHAGWRGTLKRIVESGVGRMRMEFGSRPEDLIAAIGPGIGACCYAIGEEVQNEFESQFSYASELFFEAYDSDPIKEKYPLLFLTARAPGHSNIGPKLHLDLVKANGRQLLDAGLLADSIFVQGDCTSCRTDHYFSHRADHGFTGRSLSVIGIRA